MPSVAITGQGMQDVAWASGASIRPNIALLRRHSAANTQETAAGLLKQKKNIYIGSPVFHGGPGKELQLGDVSIAF